MTRKEILKAIADNPNRALYVKYGDSGVMMLHTGISKTRLLKNSKLIHSFRILTYAEERPDLATKWQQRDPAWGNQAIITFDATTRSGKTLKDVLKEMGQPL